MKKIPLTQGQFALVDDADFAWLSQWKWQARLDKSSGYYAARTEWTSKTKCRTVRMHRVILGVVLSTVLIDHKDHNTLNNQRENLRKATSSQNTSNRRPQKQSSSKFLGVHYAKNINKWVAQIQKGDVNHRLGSFDNEVEAAKAYNSKAVELHGPFANLNQI